MRDLPTIPEGLDLLPTLDGVTVQKVWLTWRTAPQALFAVLWDSFLFFWYSQALSKPNPPLMTILFPIGHVAVGVGITYYVLASLVNKTDVIVSPSQVTVFTGPAPWIGNKTVQADEIRDVMMRERTGNRNGRTFAVMYADRSRKERNLVRALAESDQAEFIAAVIRRTLQIAPRTAGESGGLQPVPSLPKTFGKRR